MSEECNNPYSSLLVDCNDALKRSAEFLQLALDGVPPVERAYLRQYYLVQQAKSVASVAQDVHLLVKHERFQNVVGLCRLGFESRIHVYAAMKVPDFAAQKYLAQAKGNVQNAEEIVAGGFKSAEFKQELENQRNMVEQMRRDFSGVRERQWKISEAAVAAGLKADYDQHYDLLSKAAHNTPTGLASKDDRRIVASSVLRLFHDTVQTCACLVFFRERDDSKPQPMTENWLQLTGPVRDLTAEYGQLSERLNKLFKDEFGI